MKLLETTSLSIGYSAEKPLQSYLSMQVRSGEIISLMGQNGVGKTTFIKTISGLLPALSGHVKLVNEEISSLTKNQIAQRMSVVLTERPFSLNMTVIELIALGRHPYSNWMGTLSMEDRNAIDWAIEETKVNYLASKKLFELSDGQLQKVMITRALAQQTDLILLDEPTAHLDLYNKLEVVFLLRKIAKLGKGIIISTHDLQIATQLSDRLWLFNFNELAQEGVPEDLILSKTLEKTLYLQDFGYDMTHGMVRFPAEKRAISVHGSEQIKFWTEQALSRNGYELAKQSDLQLEIGQKSWKLTEAGKEKVFSSIEDLLKGLKEF